MKVINILNREQEQIEVDYYPANNPKAVLIIAHGASEHIKRYEPLATFLADNGVDVYGYDHKGHGVHKQVEEPIVYFKEKNGDESLVNDLEDVCLYAYQHSAKLPLYVLGHSMGSLITRVLLSQTKISFNGVILTGTLNPPTKLIKSAKLLAKLNQRMFGAKGINKKINKIAFGDLHERISYNQENVEKYHQDKRTGLPFSNAALNDLFNLTDKAIDEHNIQSLQRTNYLFMSGKDDQFSDNTEQVKYLTNKLDEYKITNEYHFYHGMKHEILNEDYKEEVFADILKFINETLGS